MNKQIISKDRVYQWHEDPLFHGYIPADVPTGNPWLGYKGPKISLAEWKKILAFFKWSYNESKSETQVRLYLNPKTGQWKAWAFPQEYGTGMTATELPESDCSERRKAGLGSGWVVGGTVHHHCAMKAFQSGTDSANEKTQNGVHITVGNVDKNFHDLHGRVSFKGMFYEAGWAEWFEMPPGLEGLPSHFADEVVEHYLCEACEDFDSFPAEWRTNLIKKPSIITTWTGPGKPATEHRPMVDWYKNMHSKNQQSDGDWRGWEEDAEDADAKAEQQLMLACEQDGELEPKLAQAALQLETLAAEEMTDINYLLALVVDKWGTSEYNTADDERAIAAVIKILEENGVTAEQVDIYCG